MSNKKSETLFKSSFKELDKKYDQIFIDNYLIEGDLETLANTIGHIIVPWLKHELKPADAQKLITAIDEGKLQKNKSEFDLLPEYIQKLLNEPQTILSLNSEKVIQRVHLALEEGLNNYLHNPSRA